MADIQTERAFQKQDGVFLASKKVLAKKAGTGVRFYKKIGLGKSQPASPRQVFSKARLAAASYFSLFRLSLTGELFCDRLQDPPDGH